MASDADPFGLVGRTLEQGVTVERVVGEGGFGVVYRAHHPGLGAPVAVKVLKLEARLSHEQRENLLRKFREETQVLYKLSQLTLSVARALGVGSVELPNGGWAPYTMLEWLEGKSLLDDLMERRAKGMQGRGLEEVVAILDPIADALERAHGVGVVHRDVKPANIFLADGPAGAATKLLDFGIAKVLKDGLPAADTATNMRAFTPAYAAPEQYSARFGVASARTDVFALALVAVEMLTDRNPLGVDDPPMMMHATLDPSSRPTPKAMGVDVGPGVEASLRAALAIDPFDRPASMAVWWSAFKDAAKTGEYRPQATPRAPAAPNLEAMDTAAFSDLLARGATEKTPSRNESPKGAHAGEKVPVVSAPPHTTSSPAMLSPAPPPARIEPPPSRALRIGAGVVVAAALVATLAMRATPSGSKPPSKADVGGTANVSTTNASTTNASATTNGPGIAASVGARGAEVSADDRAKSDGARSGSALAAQTIPSGALPSGLWLPKFTFAREPVAGRVGYFGAIDQCNAEGLSLCTELQWLRACEVDPRVGEVAATTMTVDDARGVVVRGGSAGCSGRDVVTGANATSSQRPIACCTRGIAIESANTNTGFLATTQSKLLAFEKATGAADAAAIAPLLGADVTYFATPKPRDQAATELAKAGRLPDAWSYDVRCRVTLESGTDPTWTADCQKVARHADHVSVFTTRYVWGGPDAAIVSISSLAVTRPFSPL